MTLGRGGWEADLERWLTPFLAHLSHRARRSMCPLYVAGLIGPGDRKSVQPMAERLGLGSYDRLHHFVSSDAWDAAPLEAELLVRADAMVGGPDAYLVIDDTALPKKGTRSVGVAPQYASALGKNANCQTLVSLTLARDEVPVPLSLRLFLPETWTGDSERLKRAGVPEAERAPCSKPEIALAELDRIRAAGVRFGPVLADAGYGISASFRQALSARGLIWAVGIPRIETGLPSRGRDDLASASAQAFEPTADPGQRGDCSRGNAGEAALAGDQLAAGHQGRTEGRVRGAACACGGRAGGAPAWAQQSAHARRGGVACWRAPLVG